MNHEQFDLLRKTNVIKNLITAKDLKDKNDRTLLYGYTCVRETWHVYLADGEIYVVVYLDRGDLSTVIPVDNEDYVPDKRLYPERCDYEFCMLLKKEGIYLPFTGYSGYTSEEGVYYGEVLECK